MDNTIVKELPGVKETPTVFRAKPLTEEQRKQSRLKSLIHWAKKGLTFSSVPPSTILGTRRTSVKPHAPVWARDVQKRQKAARRIMRAHQP